MENTEAEADNPRYPQLPRKRHTTFSIMSRRRPTLRAQMAFSRKRAPLPEVLIEL